MNSNSIVSDYATDPGMLYGAHFVTLVSDTVSYDHPTGKFTMQYVTPNTQINDPFDKQLPNNRNSNVINKDNLGTSNITESNYIELTVPRHFFYIKESVIITNKTPCMGNLAKGAGTAAATAASSGAEAMSKVVDKAGAIGGGVSAALSGDIPSAVNNTVKSFIPSAGPGGEEAAKTGIVNAAEASGATKNGPTALMDAMKNVTKFLPMVMALTGKTSTVDLVTAAGGVLAEVTKNIPDQESKARPVGKAASSASALSTIATALAAANDLASITSVIGVPGMPAVTAIQSAGAIFAQAAASKASRAAAALAAGLSLAELTKIGGKNTSKITGAIRQIDSIYKTIESTEDWDANKALGVAQNIGSMVGSLTGKPMDFNKYISASKSVIDMTKIASSDGDGIDKALSIARNAASTLNSVTGQSLDINKYISVVSSAQKLAKLASQEGVKTANLVSAAGGTAAEVARAFGSAQIAELALSAQSKIIDTLKIIDLLTKKNPNIADIAEAAAIAAGVAAGASAGATLKAGLQQGISKARSFESKVKQIASDFGASSTQMKDATTEQEKLNQPELEAQQNAIEQAQKDKKEEKTDNEIVEGIHNSCLQTLKDKLGDNLSDISDLSLANAQAHGTIEALRKTKMSDETIKNLILNDENFKQELTEKFPNKTQDEITKIEMYYKSLVVGNLEGDRLIKEGKSPTEAGEQAGKAAADEMQNQQSKYPQINASNGTGTGGTGTNTGLVNPGAGGNVSGGTGEEPEDPGSGLSNPGQSGGNNTGTGNTGGTLSPVGPGPVVRPTQQQIDNGKDRAAVSAKVGSETTGKAGGTADQAVTVAGNNSTAIMNEIPNIEESDVKDAAAKGSATATGNVSATTNQIEKDMKAAEKAAVDKATEDAESIMDTGKNNPSFCGIGTCSPVVVHVRKEYTKGTKFIVIHAGGNIDIPQIIGVVGD